MATATTLSPAAISAARVDQYRCECGHVLQVFGNGRHRIYFPLANTALDDPVMEGLCPNCGRTLPGKNP